MKKLTAVLVVSALAAVFVLSACGGSGNKGTDTKETVPAGSSTQTGSGTKSGSSAEIPGMVLGGWTVSTDAVEQLTDEQKEVFAKAVSEMVGVDYEPVIVLASQVVAGRNLAYLCTSKAVTPKAEPEWSVVVVYQDPQQNVSVTGVIPLDITDLQYTEAADAAEAVGAWAIQGNEDTGSSVLPQDAEDAFNKAKEGYTGVSLRPIALLATQLVSGTNYKILCEGTVVTADPVTSLYVVDVYEDLQGNAEITDVQMLDLMKYISE